MNRHPDAKYQAKIEYKAARIQKTIQSNNALYRTPRYRIRRKFEAYAIDWAVGKSWIKQVAVRGGERHYDVGPVLVTNEELKVMKEAAQ